MKTTMMTTLNQMYNAIKSITPEQYFAMIIAIFFELTYAIIFIIGLLFFVMIFDILRLQRKTKSLRRAILEMCFYCHLFRMVLYYILIYLGVWVTQVIRDDIFTRLAFFGIMCIEIYLLDYLYKEVTGKSFLCIIRKFLDEKFTFWKKK